jgi:2-isopropylmalate synthase
MPFTRYVPLRPPGLPERTWPDRVLHQAPRWLSTDLRDGNQALANPMDLERKLHLFDLLVSLGFTEIEVGFPAASQPEFDFVRHLIRHDLIPDQVRISVLTPARDELIERTVRSLAGSRTATVHLYNATSPQFRDLVFGVDREACKAIAVDGTRLAVKYGDELLPGTELGFEYSPELFVDTEPDFAVEVCEAVMDVWRPGPDREIILNLPATVERSTPNVLADQIEWFGRQISRREHLCISVHPHNDRGTAVAAAELAVLAGADRIEGCLFGNGERTGNVCLVTLALNLFSRGIDPLLDLSALDDIRRTVEFCTGLPVPPRHPYAGELVYTAFSGSHQDAIDKGFRALAQVAERTGRSPDELAWQVPYLPIDPRDVGRSYQAVIRVNSQSGKGGIGYLMKMGHGLDLPRDLRADFSAAIQLITDTAGGEVDPHRLWIEFTRRYLDPGAVLCLLHHEAGDDGVESVTVRVGPSGEPTLHGRGNGPVSALCAALRGAGLAATVQEFTQHSTGTGTGTGTAAYARCEVNGVTAWGAGLDGNIVVASLRAVYAAAVRAARAADISAGTTGKELA